MIKSKTYEKIIGSFPVGYFDFSNIEAMNYQLNRYYSFGLFDRDELYSIGQKADSFEKWIKIFTELGEKAEAEGNILRAATCIRAAHFYTLSDVKDTSGKSPKSKLYERCRSLYDRYYAFQDLVAFKAGDGDPRRGVEDEGGEGGGRQDYQPDEAEIVYEDELRVASGSDYAGVDRHLIRRADRADGEDL